MDTTQKTQLDQTEVDQLETTLESTIKLSPDLFNTYHYPDLDMSSILSTAGQDTITLSNITSPMYSTPGTYTVGTSAPGFTFSNGTTNITSNPWASINTTTQAGRMELTGEHADLVINGVSILGIIQDRLNVMIPNPALEKEWDQLKVLGDQYRELEKKLKEQSEMWAKLNAMPPPDPL